MKQGGFREGSGRKPKASEIELIELLSPLEAQAFEALAKGVNSGEFNYIKLFFEYRYGKPKQQIDLKTQLKSDIPLEQWLVKFRVKDTEKNK